jgi:hypothetical protein
MQRIYYAGDVILTGTVIATALLSYAAALARNSESQPVTFPARRDDGSLHDVTVLIGPASQLIAESVDSEFDEVTDDALVARLGELTALLGQPRAQAVSDSETDAEAWTELELPDL